MFAAVSRFDGPALDAHDRRYRRWIAARLRSGRAAGRIATIDGQPVGSGVVWLQPSQPRPAGPFETTPYLMSIYVEPSCRGRGVGSAVTRALVAWARALGYTRVTLHASPFGRPVYRRLGFERSWEMRLGGPSIPGPEPRRPYDEGPDARGSRRRGTVVPEE